MIFQYLERWVYDRVKHRPWVKDTIKKVYQSFFSFSGRWSEVLPQGWLLRENCFFGFHDKSPWSADKLYLLAHRYEGVGNEVERASQPVKVVVFTGENWTIEKQVGYTSAWNWQQGSQLQWLGKQKQIIFNDFVDGICQAVSYNLKGELVNVYPYPIAAVSPDASSFASICFKTLGTAMPGYGYDFHTAHATSNVTPDTLLIFDQHGTIVTKLTGETLPDHECLTSDSGTSFISHATYSKSGKNIAFMRRLSIPGKRLKSALYVLDLNSGDISKLPFQDMVSHYCWLDDEVILAYANNLKKDGYFKVNIKSMDMNFYSNVLGKKDGHPSSDASGSKVVFDAYPDKRRLQRLALVDMNNNKVNELARLYSPMRFWASKRVDLHPRLRADGEWVCIDSSTSGSRSLVTFPVLKNKAHYVST